VLDRVQELEHRGYAFEVADASFELLVRRERGRLSQPFTLESYRVLVERTADGTDVSEATVRLVVDGERALAVGEGVGPVHALDQALRRALAARHPELDAVRLVDFKVRILDGRDGTRAVTRVLVTSADADGEWTTVGVSDDIVTASWEALADGIHYGLLRARRPAPVA
jgi:2-isopropylmalate synthase